MQTLNTGDIVKVTIDNQANVMLVDAINYMSYQRGESFRYCGGWQRRSPVHLKAPYGGTWYVVIDLGGASGMIRHSITVIKNIFAPV